MKPNRSTSACFRRKLVSEQDLILSGGNRPLVPPYIPPTFVAGSRLPFTCSAVFYAGLGKGKAMHIVELQYSNDAAAKIVATIRKWLDSGKAQPAIRYSLLGAATVLRVDFELEGEAHAFAQAFGGTVVR